MALPAVPADTDPAVFDRQVACWRRMTLAERVVLIEQLNADVTALAIAGIRSRRPAMSDREVGLELVRRRHGDEWAEAVASRAER